VAQFEKGRVGLTLCTLESAWLWGYRQWVHWEVEEAHGEVEDENGYVEETSYHNARSRIHRNSLRHDKTWGGDLKVGIEKLGKLLRSGLTVVIGGIVLT